MTLEHKAIAYLDPDNEKQAAWIPPAKPGIVLVEKATMPLKDKLLIIAWGLVIFAGLVVAMAHAMDFI